MDTKKVLHDVRQKRISGVFWSNILRWEHFVPTSALKAEAREIHMSPHFVVLLRSSSSCLVTMQRRYVVRLRNYYICRYLGGDMSIVDEICRIRGFQEELAAQTPPLQLVGQVQIPAYPVQVLGK